MDGNPKFQLQEFYDACRNAVARDLLHMKQRQFDHFANAEGEIECDITSKLVAYADTQTPALQHNRKRQSKGWEVEFPGGTLTHSKDAQLSTHFAYDALD
ncbi:MAG: hypothetical protein E5X33_27195 [Mesorhizobium sp.]|uniref:hypothetical protein n=1 Tax=Mesorhizobium sp. TaxID=1871066 RepID=UPI001224733D|nr:hypothetical protein [Mesorhizobium sp.]TIR17129.1 MAG: hypothetical protein E5X33_27195 [Mesorhizobium sp.]